MRFAVVCFAMGLLKNFQADCAMIPWVRVVQEKNIFFQDVS